jgi:predicted polyphosphate/ATP-dependent NAD kinase
MLVEMGAGCILTLGGDGTNRAVAKGCRSTPLVAVSTGTNNVFPVFLEGTVAGMAAGLVAARRAGANSLTRAPLLEVAVDGVPTEVALIDVVASSMHFVGSRALWDLSLVREAVISRVTPATIGLSALGGALLASAPAGKVGAGMYIDLGPGGQEVLVALAPGLVRWVGVARYQWLVSGPTVRFRPGAGTVALDGEREIGLAATSVVEVRFSADGPFVVNVPAAMEEAARAGFLHR